MELVFADVERAPHVAHHGYGHDGGTGAYELADLGIDVGDFTFHLGGLNGLVHIGADFGHGTTGAVDLCLGGCLVFLTGTFDGHVVLALGGFLLCLHGLILGEDFIALLGSHDALVEEALHAVVALLGNLGTGLGLLPKLIGALNLLLAGSVLGLGTEGCGCGLCTLGLLGLGLNLRGIEDGEGIAYLHVVALLDAQFEDAPGNLAGNAVFGDFHFTLDIVGCAAEGEKADEGYDDYYGHESDDGQEYVVMLLFC